MESASGINNRRRGALVGLAVGDALGAAVEFESPGTFPLVTGFRGNGPHRLAAGEWTDDTSMALALADSIAHTGWNLDDQLQRYVRWWRNGEYSVNGVCFDIGMTTGMALERYVKFRDPTSCGDTHPRSSGNGSIMRLAPVAIGFADLMKNDVQKLLRLATESSQTTHASEQCVSACRYFALVLCGLIHGVPRERVLDSTWEHLAALEDFAPLHPEIREVARGSFRRKAPPAIVGSGYVVESLEAALWAFHQAPSFQHAVLEAVNLGDDADTTGAVCGQLAGAYWGESGIPSQWCSELARQDMIDSALAGLGATRTS